MTKIKEDLVDSNRWWKTTFRVEYKEREIYKEILKYLKLPQIIAFTGLIRVGKTTLMYKIIQDYISKGFNPKNILYFSFDEYKETDIKEILNEYEKIVEKNIQNEKYLILLDEIQKIENWEEKLKRIYDLYSKNIKIIITGSESLFIKKKSKETLAGRIFEFKIETLTFKEFLKFKGKKFQNIKLYEKEIQQLYEGYKISQGFPELVDIKDKEIIKKYIKESIIEKVIYRDIANLFNIKDISILESLLNIFMENPGQIIELSELGKELQISRQTLSNYIRYLEESFLIRKLYNYSKNQRKVERKLKKYYPTIISPNLIFKEDNYSKSKAFEALLVNQLKAEYFYRDPYKNEVDVIIDKDKLIPIEIKYGKIETKGLISFMKKFNVKEGVILSSDKEKKIEHENKIINVIPAFKYLSK
jgi:uncharacterized protein